MPRLWDTQCATMHWACPFIHTSSRASLRLREDRLKMARNQPTCEPMAEPKEDDEISLSRKVVTIVTGPEQTVKRTKYAWVVLTAAFLSHFLNPSINYAAGVFHVAFLERFHNDITLTAWLGAFYTSMFALAGPVASLVTNIFDCRACMFASGVLGLVGYSVSAVVTDLRVLFVTYGLIAGLGTAFAQVSSVVILGYYFPHDTALASGIVVSGSALGIFVHPPLLQTLIDWYGLSGAFLLTGAIVSHCCIFGLLMRPSKNELARKIKLRSGRTINEVILFSLVGDSVRNRNIFREFSFLFFLTSTLLLAMGYSVHILFLPDYMEHVHAASPQEASLVISFIGIGSFLSRLIVGALANDSRVGPEITYFSIIGLTAVVSVFISVLAEGTGGRLTYGLLLGLYTGGVFSLQSAIALEITGVQNFPMAYGAVMFFMGLGYLTGSPIAGSIYETTGNYNYVFVCSSIMFFASSSCGLLSALGKRSRDSTVAVQTGSRDINTAPETVPLSETVIS